MDLLSTMVTDPQVLAQVPDYVDDALDVDETDVDDTDMSLSYLPSEVLLEIWNYLSRNDRLRCRLVCRQWLQLWYSCRRCKIPIKGIQICRAEYGSQLTLRILKYGNFAVGKEMTISNDALTLSRVLSTVALQRTASPYGISALSIEGPCATREVLDIILKQKWDIAGLTVFGDIRKVNQWDLCHFIKNIHKIGSGLQTFMLTDAIAKVGQLTDQLVEAIPDSVKTIIIDLKNCRPQPQQNITDASVERLMQVGRQNIILPHCLVTVKGVERAIKEYFRSCARQADTSFMGCLFFPLTFKIVPGAFVDFGQLNSFEMDGIRTTFFPKVRYDFRGDFRLSDAFNGGTFELSMSTCTMKARIYFEVAMLRDRMLCDDCENDDCFSSPSISP